LRERTIFLRYTYTAYLVKFLQPGSTKAYRTHKITGVDAASDT